MNTDLWSVDSNYSPCRIRKMPKESTLSWTLPLQMQSVPANYSYHFIIKFVVTGSLSNFLLNSLNSHHRFQWMKLKYINTFFGWVTILHLCCILVERV